MLRLLFACVYVAQPFILFAKGYIDSWKENVALIAFWLIVGVIAFVKALLPKPDNKNSNCDITKPPNGKAAFVPLSYTNVYYRI
jgi:hypothetical protein